MNIEYKTFPLALQMSVKMDLEGKFFSSTNQKFVFHIAFPWRI